MKNTGKTPRDTPLGGGRRIQVQKREEETGFFSFASRDPLQFPNLTLVARFVSLFVSLFVSPPRYHRLLSTPPSCTRARNPWFDAQTLDLKIATLEKPSELRRQEQWNGSSLVLAGKCRLGGQMTPVRPPSGCIGGLSLSLADTRQPRLSVRVELNRCPVRASSARGFWG